MNNFNATAFEMPPRQNTEGGKPRRVGFELEFSGIDLAQTVDCVRAVLGGEVTAQTEAEVELKVEGLGTFNLEIDWAYLKHMAAEPPVTELGQDWLELLKQAAELVVPIEVVCPPIAVSRLVELSPMVNALKEAGAMGTEESLISAYGVHINTEIPALDAATLQTYIQAYALLQWWLVDTHKVDVARRISPYINLYPEAYLKQVLLQTEVTMDQIFDAYLQHNPSRNRALDLLPLLAEIDEQRVRRAVDDPRIKARPAFHYRLPDCHIEQTDWSLQVPWSSWLVVEKLASRPQDLKKLATHFLNSERPLLDVSRSDWVEFMDQWLQDHELV
ncbi:hypothetical protein G8770_11980 [Aestuariicella hydrocarbonica]|uniref:Amidoligase enzyme n=1 Tax=Pseudomaricurvus hydrocarbonicus TaxID=1470433 RepID=A0A9E5MM46_9GAMM|nr:amidoligase family protein [Aestuariicella hydrocarbonica]NHO66263.1 hypothetical protein [Aestuariicella hydrocarbonica]